MKVQELLDGLEINNKKDDTLYSITLYSDESGHIKDCNTEERVLDFSDIEELKDYLEKDKPKVGDVGYFWNHLTNGVTYGKIAEISNKTPCKYRPFATSWYKNFSKTPPKID